MTTARILALTMLLAAVAAPPATVAAPPPPSKRDAWARSDIPAAFHGTWVRGDAACGAALSLTIEAKRVSFRNGRQAQRFDRLSVCKNCSDPSDKSGTVWVRGRRLALPAVPDARREAVRDDELEAVGRRAAKALSAGPRAVEEVPSLNRTDRALP
jgi:hypothetical protein